MKTVDGSLFLQSTSTPNRYFCDASTLGLRAGEWPEKIKTTLGSREYVFQRGAMDGEDSVIYLLPGGEGPHLMIIND